MKDAKNERRWRRGDGQLERPTRNTGLPPSRPREGIHAISTDRVAHSPESRDQEGTALQTTGKRILGRYLREACERNEAKIAAVSYQTENGLGASATFGELMDRVSRLSAGLSSLGVEPGSVVTLMLPNRLDFSALVFAILDRGAVYSGIPIAYGEREVQFMLEQTRSRVLVIPSSYGRTDHVERALLLTTKIPSLEHVVVLGPNRDGFLTVTELEKAATIDMPDVREDALAHIGFTSGTTTAPKGVINTHRALDAVTSNWIDHIGPDLLNDETVNLVASPVGHHTGFLWGAMMSAQLGATAVYLDRWSPAAAAAAIEELGVSIMVAAPTFLQDLVAYGLDTVKARSLRMIAVAGAPIPRSLVWQASETLGCFVCPAWGMTEYGIGISGAPHLPSERVNATDGIPVPGCEARIVDSDGAIADSNTEGELEIRGDGLFSGYFERPDATQEAFNEGWFRTGDRAVIHDDGFVSLTGRSKDVIIRGGENIPVVSVESLLYEHPAVVEAAVVGVPDERLGERACAVLVLRQGAASEPKDILDFLLRKGLSAHFVPERVELLPSLPKTPSGKIRKVELRAWLAGGPLPESGP